MTMRATRPTAADLPDGYRYGDAARLGREVRERLTRLRARELEMRDGRLVRDGQGVLWLVGDGPDGTTYKQRAS